jgi:site-specific DNA-cytosine methylase
MAVFLILGVIFIIVLSLFDGISCGQIALERVGIKIEKYYASEIKDCAIKLTKHHFPNTIHIGDVTAVTYKDGVLYTEKGNYETEIDFIIGGSPCQDFSFAKWMNFESEGLKGDKSRLFYEYLRILNEVQPKYFFLENVKMLEESEHALNDMLGVKGIHIDSNLVSFQNRHRIYWTNIPNVTIPNDRQIDFQIYKNSDHEYCKQYKLNKTPYRDKMWNNGQGKNDMRLGCLNITNAKKINCLTRKQDRNPNSGLIEFEEYCRYLTREEIEKAQTLPSGYTSILSYRQMQDVCGDCWTVDVVAWIFKNLGKEPIVANRIIKKESEEIGQSTIFDYMEE